MIVVVMGVSGSGKTTVGSMLAHAMKCSFLEGDSLHSKENVEKMSHGIPLNDADRAPWLASIRAHILDFVQRQKSLVVVCSALKQQYRDFLAQEVSLCWVYLKGSEELIRSRSTQRSNHFMKADMLRSQFEALEEPQDAIVADVSLPPSVIVEQVLTHLRQPEPPSMKSDLRVFDDVNALSLRAAEASVTTINDSVRAKGSCSLVLSGGNTPRTLYGLLSAWSPERIPWTQVHIFWGDERYVPLDDPQSNYRMAKETLLDHVPCPAGNLHSMPTHYSDSDVAARYYERILRSYFSAEWPRFDLILLGLGEEGHTASLFPGSPALKERSRWVLPVQAPAEPSVRLTLTLPVLTHAANIYFLLTGVKKAEALHHVLAGTAGPQIYPAAGVRVPNGNLVWWVDREAAVLLTQQQLNGSGTA